MSIKGLSKAASALALVGVVAPFLVQSVGADEEQPTSALKDVAGVSNFSGSQIIDSAASGDNNSGSASGISYAGIGFKSGDLILYQVPNFDFSMDNKIAADIYKMIANPNSADNNRMAVIVDNRYTQTGVKASDNESYYNWTLNAQAGNFLAKDASGNVVSTLDNNDAEVLINDSGTSLKYNIPESQNGKDQPKKLYKPANNDEDSADGLTFAAAKTTNILGANPMIASASNSKFPGPTGINFKDIASAEFVVLPGSTTSGIAKIVPNAKYVSNITWTLSASPLH